MPNTGLYEEHVVITGGSGKPVGVTEDGALNIKIQPYGDIIFDPNDKNPDYIGLNTTKGASTADNSWLVYRFFKSGVNIIQIQKLENIAWDNRGTAF